MTREDILDRKLDALRREVLVPTRQMVVEGLRSDHRPLAVKVQVRAKKRR